MTPASRKRARLPVSYDTGLGRGGEPPLSTPTQGQRDRSALVIFRCSSAEKQELLDKAKAAGVSMSMLMREALGLVEARRRRPTPRVDPALVLQVARIGGNLNQIARCVNSAVTAGHTHEIDALVVAVRLVAIERALSLLASPRTLACLQASADTNATDQIVSERHVVARLGVQA